MDVVEGNLKKPKQVNADAKPEERAEYETCLANFLKAESNALIILTTNMTEETLQKIMRFTTAREVWLELHRLFDGISEDKAYDLCLQFFSYKREAGSDIASHMSKLKNLWNDLKQEIAKDKDSNCELPELLLICKILGTLPEEYFSFKSSWMLMAKAERTIENLTNQLCAYERALACKESDCSHQEALVVKTSVNPKARTFGNNNSSGFTPAKIRCHYCKKLGHKVKQCSKWKSDGRPQKSEKPRWTDTTTSERSGINMTILKITDGLNADCDPSTWFADNGATNHVTNQRDLFQTFEPFSVTHTVTTANGESVEAKGKGSIEVEAAINGHWERILLTDVWYVPSIKKNLFSILSAQDKNAKSEFKSTSVSCTLKINGKVKLIGTRSKFGGLFKLALRNVTPKRPADVNLLSNENLLQLYHERLGHQNKRHVKAIISRELGINVKLDSEICEGCMYGKAHRLKFGTRERATKPGELIHSDVCGPFLYSLSGYRYFVLFKDDYSRFRYVYFIKEKSEVSEKLEQMLAETKVAGHTVKELLSDNGGEFDNGNIKKILRKNGIRHRLTMPYSPEQNGCSERENRTIVETARALMHSQEELPQGLWAEMTNTATYILNRTGPSSIEGKSPYELWTGKKPSLKHLRIIGCICYAHTPKQRRKKMDKKAQKGVLVGYDNNDGYRIWCKENNKLIRSRDVVFQEEPLIQMKKAEIPINVDLYIPEKKSDAETQTKEMESSDMSDHDYENDTDGVSNDEEDDKEENKGKDTVKFNMQLRERSKIKQPQRYSDDIMSAVASIIEINEPYSFTQAIESKEQEKWKCAMENEMKSLKENETWTLEELPIGKKAIPCKWVYKVKTNPDGSTEKFKARLVIKGFSQRKGIDYNQTFSPVAKSGTIRTLLSVAASERMFLMQFDVSTAFLYGELDETIYMKQPQGFSDGTDRVCHLKRSLYGLKQAPRCWNKRFGNYLLKLGFKRSDADPCLFIQKQGIEKLLVALYVDDGLVASTNKHQLEKFIHDLREEFKIVAKPASYFLGLELDHQEDGTIKVKQTAYTKKILERFGMSECKPVTTPIIKESNKSGKVETESDLEKEDFPYRQAVGALMYLMVGTRPDIAYAVGVASRTLENPTKSDWIQVKRIFRYLKGTENYGITYKPGYKKGMLESFSDADHGGDETTGRSTSGVVCMYAGGAISWLSQRQASVSISTTEAEVVAASEAAREMIWLKRLLQGIVDLEVTPELQVDNEAAIRLAQNPEYHRRTKHIKTRHFFVRELVTTEEITVKRVATEFQIADIMTKPLHKPRLKQLSEGMGLNSD